MSRSFLGACCALFGLSCVLGADAQAQVPRRYRIRVFQRMTTLRNQTMIRFATGKPDTPEVEQTGDTSQIAATLVVSFDKTLPRGAVRWNATVEKLAFTTSSQEPPLPDGWPVRMREKQEIRRQIAVAGTRRVVESLRGAPFAFVRELNGRISSFDLSGIEPRCKQIVSHAGREDTDPLAEAIAPLQTAQFWQRLLYGQAPRAPAVLRAGATTPYAVSLFLMGAPDVTGISTVNSVAGEGTAARAEVVSLAQGDLPFGTPSPRVPDSAEIAIAGKFNVSAHTSFSSVSMWPVEHDATEQLQGETTITGVDKAKRAHLIDRTPFTVDVQSRLVATPY